MNAGTVYAMASTSLASFFSDLVRCETRVYNALSDTLRAEHGIVLTQFELLRYLRDHDDARVADIATTFAVGIGATSKIVDRHERTGWLARRPNPADRRSSLLSLTPAGRQLVDEAEPTFTTRLGELLGDVENLPELTHALALLRAALERDQVGMPVG